MESDPLSNSEVTAPLKGLAAADSPAAIVTHAPRIRVLQAQQLFGVAKEVVIQHAGATYRLRITQANKLILTK